MVPGKALPRGTEKSSEFKRYQQALAALYLVAIGAGTLLLAASVVRELLFRPVVQPPPSTLSQDTLDSPDEPPHPRQDALDPGRLRQCHQKVATLLEQLDERANELLQAPLGRDQRDVLPAWDAFVQTWRHEWEIVNGWCRFWEHSDTRQGEAHTRLADAHAKLPALELKYRSLLARFEDELAADLVELQRDLQQSRRLLSGDSEPRGADREEAR